MHVQIPNYGRCFGDSVLFIELKLRKINKKRKLCFYFQIHKKQRDYYMTSKKHRKRIWEYFYLKAWKNIWKKETSDASAKSDANALFFKDIYAAYGIYQKYIDLRFFPSYKFKFDVNNTHLSIFCG